MSQKVPVPVRGVYLVEYIEGNLGKIVVVPDCDTNLYQLGQEVYFCSSLKTEHDGLLLVRGEHIFAINVTKE